MSLAEHRLGARRPASPRALTRSALALMSRPDAARRSCPADSAPAPGWRRWSSPGPTSCCSTSRPTTSIATVARPCIALCWRAGAAAPLVVSHDRELLDTHGRDRRTDVARAPASYGGNWSHYRARKAIELAAARQRSRRRRTPGRRPRSHRPARCGSARRARIAPASASAGAATSRRSRSGCARAPAKTPPAKPARLRRAPPRAGAAAGRHGPPAYRESCSRSPSHVPSTGLPAARTVLDVDALGGGYAIASPHRRAVLAQHGRTAAGRDRRTERLPARPRCWR